jgi:ADP-dependent NAD(P)H-hydrate dehydratase / NAD(P)H-hydrate epimerase
MKVFTSQQIINWEKFTIDEERIPSIALMNRAAKVYAEWMALNLGAKRHNLPVYAKWLASYLGAKRHNLLVFAGPGNNGGDALAIARLLLEHFNNIAIYLCYEKGTIPSRDHQAQLDFLIEISNSEITFIHSPQKLPVIDPAQDVVLDGLFGSGLSRPLTGLFAAIVAHINHSQVRVYSIDIPSGMPSDSPVEGACIAAHRVLSFEQPKLAFFMYENEAYLGDWEYRSIGLSAAYYLETETPYNYILSDEIGRLLKSRERFSHKGNYGHVCLINGSCGMVGAAILSARAALRAGCGKLTAYVPQRAEFILQTANPEAMVICDPHEYHWSQAIPPDKFSAIGIGCGIGINQLTRKAIIDQIKISRSPIVIDADGLNILAIDKVDLSILPKGTILTPHPGEFNRLFGEGDHSPDRFSTLQTNAAKYGLVIVLKGAHTVIATPDGKLHFNSTGNPGMATAGSGDVLTGMITSFLAQGYSPEVAAKLGVYIHGVAGDLAAKDLGVEALIASDIVNYIGAAFQSIRKQ